MATAFEVNDFQQDVIEASRRKPVLVDFWAPWCGPCRMLSPALERLAREHEDAWTLVKVNTDEHPALSQRYGIRGIPNVKLFSDGAVVDEFTGALPEHALRRWLEEALPSKSKKQFEAARAALDEGRRERAEALLRAVLDAEPEHAAAQVLLARLLVFRDPEEAEALAGAADVAEPELLQTKEAVQTLARLLHLQDAPEALPEAPGRDAYRQALNALAAHDFDAALDRLIGVIQADRSYDDDGARKACVALFTLLGAQHPAVRAHRRRFDMALY